MAKRSAVESWRKALRGWAPSVSIDPHPGLSDSLLLRDCPSSIEGLLLYIEKHGGKFRKLPPRDLWVSQEDGTFTRLPRICWGSSLRRIHMHRESSAKSRSVRREKPYQPPPAPDSGLLQEPQWHDASRFTIVGKGWMDGTRVYERFPMRAEGQIPEKPWRQSLASAGVSIRFESDAEMFYARWVDYNDEWAKNQSPENHLALYVRHEGQWRWLGTAKEVGNGPTLKLINDPIPSLKREYMLYLPQARGVRYLEIGIPKNARMRPSKPRTERPVVYHGTSIIHGASASRPGLNVVALLERHFDYPFLNLGLSGSACMEPEVIDLVAEIDACVYLIDCLPNMVQETVRERFVPSIRALRKARPHTPIIVVESVLYEDGFLVSSRQARCVGSNTALREGYARLIGEGVQGLAYVPGDLLFGGEEEVTRDGTHPTDFGYRCMAKTFIPLIAPHLERGKPRI